MLPLTTFTVSDKKYRFHHHHPIKVLLPNVHMIFQIQWKIHTYVDDQNVLLKEINFTMHRTSDTNTIITYTCDQNLPEAEKIVPTCTFRRNFCLHFLANVKVCYWSRMLNWGTWHRQKILAKWKPTISTIRKRRIRHCIRKVDSSLPTFRSMKWGRLAFSLSTIFRVKKLSFQIFFPRWSHWWIVSGWSGRELGHKL